MGDTPAIFERYLREKAMAEKARRAVVQLGTSEVEGFMLPDGSYAMSQTQAAEAVALKVQNASDFLRSKTLKRLMGEDYTPQISEIQPEGEQLRGGSRIKALPLEVVAVYWQWQAHRGNKLAFALCAAFTLEGLMRRFDRAFEQERSQAEYDAELQAMQVLLAQTELQFADSLALNDVSREHIERLEAQVRQLGGEPWQPSTEES